MTARDPGEANRVSTPLELFFDLTFVAAVAQAGSSLHHGLVDGSTGHAIASYPLIFFAIWWAWVNFTWFASGYDTDDVPYRLMVFVQVTGALILAAGVPRAFANQDYGVIIIGYVVMRFALVGQWLRVAHSDPVGRPMALRYAIGITIVQVGWVLWFWLPEALFLSGFIVLAAADLAVPAWAEGAGHVAWHPQHIAERYGLFTIIVLGESVVAATVGVQAALDSDTAFRDLLTIVVGGLLIVFSMWWIYFDLPAERALERARDETNGRGWFSFVWGYGHYFVFAGAAAAGTGIAVAIDQVSGRSDLARWEAGLTLTIPVVAYLLAVWALHVADKTPTPLHRYGTPAAAVLVLATSLTAEPVLWTGVILAVLVAVHVASDERVPA
jgi:low temperature requirement protein LtrA